MIHAQLWGEFFLAALLVVLAGWRLVHYGDVIAEKLKVGRALVGMLLIGWATSLPEMVLSAGAILSIDSPDMAVGNIFGSLAFNLGILGICAVLLHNSAKPAASPRTLPLSAAYSLLLVLIALAALALAYCGVSTDSFLAIAPATFLIFAVYIYSTWALYREDKRAPAEEASLDHEQLSLRATIVKALAAAGMIVVAGLFLAQTGDKMSDLYGLSKSVIGIFFLAVVSSLPELATTITALKKGLFDMAAGNIFGSNIFNIAIIAVCDILYRKGPIFEGLSREEIPQQLTAGAVTVAMTIVVLIGLILRRRAGARNHPTRIRIEMIACAVLYLIGMILLVTLFGNP